MCSVRQLVSALPSYRAMCCPPPHAGLPGEWWTHQGKRNGPDAACTTHHCHRAAAASSAARASTQVAPPSVNSSFFQNGALVFSQSIRKAVASNAG
jgi:hypothetical protein